MGYTPKRTVYRLDFSGTELEGLEVDMRATTVGKMLDLMEAADKLAEMQELDASTQAGEIGERLRVMLEPLGDALAAWNVEGDDGTPVPATLDGLLSQEMPFVMHIMQAYQQVAQAPAPLGAGSASGGTSPEVSAAMAELSSALPS